MIRRRGDQPRWFAPVLVTALTSAVLVLGGCSGSGPSDASGSRAGVTTTPVTKPLDGFAATTITVVAADGTSRTFCVLVADTEELRQQGLMFVEDRSLGGHDGMVFVFSEDVDGAFWMRNTRLPLSIAYLRGDGSVVSTTDMAPCPDDQKTCPTYSAGGPYRFALEVPRGELARLGIGEGARVTVGSDGCGPTSTRPA